MRRLSPSEADRLWNRALAGKPIPEPRRRVFPLGVPKPALAAINIARFARAVGGRARPVLSIA